MLESCAGRVVFYLIHICFLNSFNVLDQKLIIFRYVPKLIFIRKCINFAYFIRILRNQSFSFYYKKKWPCKKCSQSSHFRSNFELESHEIIVLREKLDTIKKTSYVQEIQKRYSIHLCLNNIKYTIFRYLRVTITLWVYKRDQRLITNGKNFHQ